MNIKRYSVLILLFVLVVNMLVACSEKKNDDDIEGSVSNVQVVNKGQEIREKELNYWILVMYPNKANPKKEMKITVGEKKTWEAININKMYTIHYGKRGDGSYYLYEIDLME